MSWKSSKSSSMGLMRFRLLGSFRSSLRADTCPSMILLEFWFDVPSLRGVIGSGPAILGHLGKSNNGKPVEKTTHVSLVPDFIPGPSSGVREPLVNREPLGNRVHWLFPRYKALLNVLKSAFNVSDTGGSSVTPYTNPTSWQRMSDLFADLNLPLPFGSFSHKHVLGFMASLLLNEVKNENGYLKHFRHKHPLVLIHNNNDDDTSGVESMSLHNPMKRVKLLCDGCVRPIIAMPFYKCSQECSIVVFPMSGCGLTTPLIEKFLTSDEHTLHKYDKHPLKLSSSPVENHKGQYVCEVCEEDLNPEKWFYHCSDCDQSIHSACSTLILKSEQGANSSDDELVYKFINMKFGGVHDIEDHEHSLSFVAGTTSDGNCTKCGLKLHFKFILKCLQCKFAIHSYCQSSVTESANQQLVEMFNNLEKKRESTKKPRTQRVLTYYPKGITRPVTE
ncbi:DC1, C1-like, zinc finger, RING/FYVE/PHD-type containing protein [Tanacetum coccineum]